MQFLYFPLQSVLVTDGDIQWYYCMLTCDWLLEGFVVLRSEYLFFCDVQIQERKLAYSSLTYRGQQNIKKQICVAASHTDAILHVCHWFCPFHWFFLNIHFYAVLISVLASCPHEALHKYTVFVPVWTADSAWWRPVRPAGCWRWWKCTTPQQGDSLETRRPQIPTSDPEYTSGLQLSQWKLCRGKRRMGKRVSQ